MFEKEAKKLLPIIQAIAEGKKVQFSFNHRDWIDADENNSDLKNICASIIVGGADYRIKPEDISIAILPNKSYYKCGKKITLENMASIVLASNPPKYMCKKCAGEDTEENYTIEQNTGENRFEGGVLSVSGSVSEKHWRSEEERKSNEWHYPSKGEYPKENQLVLGIFQPSEYYTPTELVFYEKELDCWSNRMGDSEYHNIYAWKEIVLPELPKESE